MTLAVVGEEQTTRGDLAPARAAGLATAPRRTDLARAPLPANDRRGAELTVLDITKWFGESSGGVKTYLTEKACYVAARPSLRQVLVVPGPFDSYALGDGVRTYRLQGPRIPTQTGYRFLLATRSTRRIIEHERPDLIEVGSPFLVPWVTALASRRLAAPLIAFHHMSVGAPPSSASPRSRLVHAWGILSAAYLRRLNRLFRVTVVASHYACDELQSIGIDRVRYVPLGVDLACFHPANQRLREFTRRRLGWPLDRPVVVYVGRLAREKRLDVVIDAWPDVHRRTGAQLVVAGAGSDERALRGRASGAGISWLPYQRYREAVARLFAAADACVAPGERETFGLSALEAMASGIPVVAPASGGGGELVQRSGAGQVYAPGSALDASRALCSVLEGDHKQLGRLGRVHAEQEHDWATVFDRLFTLYREVLHT